jgi:hypothetical protein
MVSRLLLDARQGFMTACQLCASFPRIIQIENETDTQCLRQRA